LEQKLGNPLVFALSAFGLAQVLVGADILLANALHWAVVYSFLLAGGLLLFAGMWQIARGESLVANISCLFGGYLVVYYLLMVGQGISAEDRQLAIAAFALVLLPPVIFLIVGAYKLLRVHFLIFLFFMALFLAFFGIGAILDNVILLNVAGVAAILAGIAIWWTVTVYLETLQ